MHICMYVVQVTSLSEKLQAKESSPGPEEQAAASGTAHAGAAGETLAVQLKEGYAALDASNGAAGVLSGFAGGANDSPESHSYFADARSPPSSSDDDCAGAVRGELGGCAFFLPEYAMLDVVAVEREIIEREEGEEAQLNSWAWFWS
jgi:homeobox-leucine zipper protein